MFRNCLCFFRVVKKEPYAWTRENPKPYCLKYYDLVEQIKKPAQCYVIVSTREHCKQYELGQLIFGHHDAEFTDLDKFYEHLRKSWRNSTNQYFFQDLEEALSNRDIHAMLPTGCYVIGFYGSREEVLASCKAGKLSSMICGAWATAISRGRAVNFMYVDETLPVYKIPCMMRDHSHVNENARLEISNNSSSSVSSISSVHSQSITLN